MRRTVVATTASSALFLFLVGGGLHAEEKPAFNKVDSDGDGSVSVEEAVDAGIPESVAKREDIDNNGKLSRKDWEYVTLERRSTPEQPEGEGGGLQGQPDDGQGQSGGFGN
ncbi:EF-hand domain-containing protein [Halorhodospira neutriphila]|uniref:EF-hand domain-containing protein n=1 Tax=Halorhodospira neutriphila TaxID=168379 RepID=A0ABS1E552_9GAMM|nr:EF-hand domain-containing protein [Halorhodospira neutriphila]MBK1725890.1 hypothetical protein [Halorhodospira neutriphila]